MKFLADMIKLSVKASIYKLLSQVYKLLQDD